MIKEIVYIVNFPWTNRDNKRFGVEYFERDGSFRTTIFDVTAVLMSDMNYDHVVDRNLSERIRLFKSKKEIAQAIAQINPKETFVFILLGADPRRNFIYRLLSKYNIRHGLLTTNIQPQLPMKVDRLLSRISNPNRVCSFLKAKAENNYNRMDRMLRPLKGVDLWVTTNEEDMNRYPFPRDDRSEILFGHTLDYDLYLNNGVKDGDSKVKTGIFLDQYLAYHHDFPRFGIDHYVTAKQYYPSLRRFFGQLKKELDINVKIAAHPRADYQQHPNCFEGFPVINGSTCNLVATSTCVIAHNTTAINFAVLYKKPVFFITTNELKASPIQLYIESIAGLLGKTVIDIDNPDALLDLKAQMEVDGKKYDSYKARYIKKPGTPELPLWEIIGRRIKQYA